jgi:uncharacterized protein YutE (UPF0331/DUF86 family)
MQLLASIESVAGLDEALLLDTFGDDWPKIKATRNVIVHAYQYVDSAIVESVVKGELSTFENGLAALEATG